MKIGHITYNYKPIIGGQEAYVDSLIGVLNGRGHRQRVYQKEGGELSELIVEVPGSNWRLPQLISFNLGLLTKRSLLKDEDVLVINYPEAFPSVSWHKNTVVISHGSTWTRGARSDVARKMLARLAFKRATQFVANDTFVLRELGLGVAPRTRMFEEVSSGKWFIPNCIDTKLFSPGRSRPGLKEKNPIIVPRNLTYSRGVDLAVAAYAQFEKKHPDTTLCVVGDAIPGVRESQEFKARVLRHIQELDLQSKVVLLGHRSRDQMPGIYSSALFTLVPTRSSEGTSLAALESMACGTPVVSTDVEGLLDLPTLKCSASSESMAEAMEAVLKKREEIALEQRSEVIRGYNLNNWQKAWLKVIEKSLLGIRY
jgi:glycosyltransferase involved in cell wall biosynthesis